MKYFAICLIFILAACDSNKNENSSSETSTPKTMTEEVVVQKVVKEELIVEKLTDKEKLQILLNHEGFTNEEKAFQEVMSFLDPYGSTFAYANFEDYKQSYISSYQRLLNFFDDGLAEEISQMDNISAFVNIVTSMGFWELDAVGLSHYKINESFNRNKFCIHKTKNDTKSYFWRCYGKPGKFNVLNTLPETTLFSTGFKVDKMALIEMNSFLSSNLKDLEKNTETVKYLQRNIVLFNKLEKFFGDEIGFSIFMGQGESTIQNINLPNISGALYIKIKESVTVDDLKGISPIKSIGTFLKEFGGEPSLIIKDGYVFICFDKTAENLLNANDSSIVKSEHFRSIQKHIPENINSYSYLNPEVTSKTYDLVVNEIEKQFPMKDFITSVYPKELLTYHFFNVTEFKENGIYMTGVSNGNSTAFIAANSLAFILHTLLFFPEIEYEALLKNGIKTGKQLDLNSIIKSAKNFELPNISKAKTEEKTFSLSDTKKDIEYIRYALTQYAKSNNGYFPKNDGSKGLESLVKKKFIKKPSHLLSDMDDERELTKDSTISENETSYMYLGDNIRASDAGYFFPIVITKPALLNDGFFVLFASNKIQYFKNGGKSYNSILSSLNKQYNYNERQKEILRKKLLKIR